MKGLGEVEYLKRLHSRWVLGQGILGAGPVFAFINHFRPILTDAGGQDLIPSLLPEPLTVHYGFLLSASLAALGVSELLRRRFHNRHKEDLAL